MLVFLFFSFSVFFVLSVCSLHFLLATLILLHGSRMVITAQSTQYILSSHWLENVTALCVWYYMISPLWPEVLEFCYDVTQSCRSQQVELVLTLH